MVDSGVGESAITFAMTAWAVGPAWGGSPFPGQHLVQHAAQGELVGTVVDPLVARRLLGAHVGGGPDGHSGGGELLASGGGHRARDPEVRDVYATLLEQDVARLDVTVHHAVTVRGLEGLAHLLGDGKRVVDGELPLPVETLAKRLPFDVRHHVEEDPSCLARIQDGQDVGVREASGDLDLTDEPVRSQGGRELGPEDLDRDLAFVLQVLGQIHGGHAALTELALEAVSVGESVSEAGGKLGHHGPLTPDSVQRSAR